MWARFSKKSQADFIKTRKFRQFFLRFVKLGIWAINKLGISADNQNMKPECLRKSIFLIFATSLFFSLGSFLSADSVYTVKKGDTLYSISRKYQITVAELRTANNLSESDILKEGARLVIPSADIRNAAALSSDNSEKNASSPENQSSSKSSSASSLNSPESRIYEVQKGDTLYGISRKFDIRLAELLSMNALDSNATIKVGQKLKVSKQDFSPNPVSSGQKSNPSPEKKSESSSVASSSSGSSSSSSSSASSSSGSSKNSSSSSVSWPLSNPSVKKVNGKVSGVLLTGKELEAVTCVREGTVMYTGVYRGFGEVVFVQSKTGLIYSYTGLGKVTCRKGDYVTFGSELGRTGKNDSSIKFMVFQNGMPIDPYKAPRG